MRTKEDDQHRIKQTQGLFKFMMDQDAFLAIAVVANPDNPHDTFQYVKAPAISDSDAIIILRSLAERIENGTVKIALPNE
jgi:hypothetical protein